MECFLMKLAYSIKNYGSRTLRWAFSMESLRSSFDRFSKIAIIDGIFAKNWYIFFRSFGKFFKHGLLIYASHKKQWFANVIQNRRLSKFRKFHKKAPMLESLLMKLQVWTHGTLLKRDSNTGVFLWNLIFTGKHLKST